MNEKIVGFTLGTPLNPSELERKAGYATKKYVQEYAQPKGNYLTEVPKGYAKTEDIPKKPEDIKAQPEGDYALKSEIPSVPVQSVNGKTGAVQLSAADVGARPSTWMPSAADVGALPNTYTPPNQTAEQVGADPKGTAANAVSGHNTNTDAHADLRLEIKRVAEQLTAFLDSDDETFDQLTELIAGINSNKTLIEAVTTGKVSVTDIIDNLNTNVANKPLSAAQGVALKALIDAITIPTKLSQLTNDTGYITGYTETDPTVPAWAKNATKPSYTASEVGLGNVDNVKQYSASNPPPYPVTSVNGKTGAVTVDVPNVPGWAMEASKPNYSASEVGAVPTSRKINGKQLSADISLAAADVGAVPTTKTITVTGIDADGVSHSWTMYGVAK